MATTAKTPVKGTKAKTAKVTKGSKTEQILKAKQKAALDEKNIKDTVKQVVESEREIRYNYPPEVDNQLDRKGWRQKVRNKLRAMERALDKEKDEKAKAKLNKEYIAYRKQVLMVP